MKTKKIKLLFPIFLFLVIVFIFSSQKVSALTITPVRVEISGNPGETITKEMTLINDKNTTVTYYVSYLNFEAQGETGNPAFVEPKDGLGTWMSAVDSVTLAPQESKTVQMKISIPMNAEPGGHFAAIFWGTVPETPGSNSVSIGAKMGMLVLLRVNGQVNEQAGIIEFATNNKQTYYTALPVSFYYRFQNLGGDRIKPQGVIKMKDIFGITEKKIPGNPVDGNILPNSIRKFETTWEGKDGATPPEIRGNFFKQVSYEWRNFAFGHYKAKLSLAYGTKNETTEAAFSFWVFPWHLLIVIIIFLVLLIFIVRKLVVSYNRWVIGQAKRMLQAEQLKSNEDGTNSTK